jgi:hypothetical protein
MYFFAAPARAQIELVGGVAVALAGFSLLEVLGLVAGAAQTMVAAELLVHFRHILARVFIKVTLP